MGNAILTANHGCIDNRTSNNLIHDYGSAEAFCLFNSDRVRAVAYATSRKYIVFGIPY